MDRFNGGRDIDMPEIPESIADRRGRRIDLRPVRPLLERMIARWNPSAIWLFGSRAKGDAQAFSDWDFLVTVADGTADADIDPLVPWRMRKEAKVRADIFPVHESDFRECRNVVNTLAYEVATDGIQVYGR